MVNLKSKIHNFNRDIANLQIKQEQYRGRYIKDQIKLLNLKLHYPRASQVRKLRIPIAASAEKREDFLISNILLSQR